MTIKKQSHAALVGVVAIGLSILPAVPSSAAPAARIYANCTAIHAVYSGGIAKKGVTYNTVGSSHRALKGKVKFDTALYLANQKSDRDRDGIACELS